MQIVKFNQLFLSRYPALFSSGFPILQYHCPYDKIFVTNFVG